MATEIMGAQTALSEAVARATSNFNGLTTSGVANSLKFRTHPLPARHTMAHQ